MFKIGVVPPQAEQIDLHTSAVKHEKSKDAFEFVDTPVRRLVKNRERVRLITVQVSA